jgi:hypothetical protein
VGNGVAANGKDVRLLLVNDESTRLTREVVNLECLKYFCRYGTLLAIAIFPWQHKPDASRLAYPPVALACVKFIPGLLSRLMVRVFICVMVFILPGTPF